MAAKQRADSEKSSKETIKLRSPQGYASNSLRQIISQDRPSGQVQSGDFAEKSALRPSGHDDPDGQEMVADDRP
jgi:hypothetical protein